VHDIILKKENILHDKNSGGKREGNQDSGREYANE